MPSCERPPLGLLVSLLFLALSTAPLAITGDAMACSLAVTLSRSNAPATTVRVFRGVTMGVMAVLLICVGAGGTG
ncbi:MAG TPA: BCCT family transporter [Pseudomonadales bacterium]|nr:BCCT family transporter [Pseudomonadales bacterium]